MDVPQHDNTQADTDTQQGADDWTLDDVTGQEVREDGTVVFHLKDGGDKELKTPTRVTNQPGSETVRAALALAKAQNRPADEVMAEIFARRNQAPATPAQNQPDPEPEPDTGIIEQLDSEIESKFAALKQAKMDADVESEVNLTREIRKLERQRDKAETQIERQVEKRQTSQEAQAAAAIEQQFEYYEAQAIKLIPELADKHSPEHRRWVEIFTSYNDPNNPVIAETAALKLYREIEAQRPQSASMLRSPQRPQFTPPASTGRGRSVQLSSRDVVAKLTPEQAMAMLNGAHS